MVLLLPRVEASCAASAAGASEKEAISDSDGSWL